LSFTFMSSEYYTHCHQCGKKLQTTLFCRGCGAAICSMECFRSHRISHDGTPPESPSTEGEASPEAIDRSASE
jgi:hypothetical protein